jgi:hypothetical protein
MPNATYGVRLIKTGDREGGAGDGLGDGAPKTSVANTATGAATTATPTTDVFKRLSWRIVSSPVGWWFPNGPMVADGLTASGSGQVRQIAETCIRK